MIFSGTHTISRFQTPKKLFIRPICVTYSFLAVKPFKHHECTPQIHQTLKNGTKNKNNRVFSRNLRGPLPVPLTNIILITIQVTVFLAYPPHIKTGNYNKYQNKPAKKQPLSLQNNF